jgi:hypothetical protein
MFHSDEERRKDIIAKREEAKKRRSQIAPQIDLNEASELMENFDRDITGFENGFRKTSSIF